jgi:hypothetical protein
MKDVNRLLIKYCDPFNNLDTITLEFKLRDHPVVGKWVDRVLLAQQQYEIDDPKRFYGFGSVEEQQTQALSLINKCIDVINNFEPVIERRLYKIDDQDTLNYLHHVFEVYHGLLDQQTHEIWLRAPKDVQRALADLNVLVHRCESVYRGARPRHVVTWYGLPKTETLAAEDYQWFEEGSKFGTVYLNYVEIGKTLEDLAHDNDQYIDSEAFRPFSHYSADFNVKFWTDDHRQIERNRSIIETYYQKNKRFFQTHDRGPVGSIPLADLVDEDQSGVLSQLESRQHVKSVLLL